MYEYTVYIQISPNDSKWPFQCGQCKWWWASKHQGTVIVLLLDATSWRCGRLPSAKLTISMAIFHINHHFPIVFPWFSHGFPMVFLWFTRPGTLRHSYGKSGLSVQKWSTNSGGFSIAMATFPGWQTWTLTPWSDPTNGCVGNSCPPNPQANFCMNTSSLGS